MPIRFQKILLEKFVDKIRFNYSNSFPEKNPFVSETKTHSFPRKTSHLFPRAPHAHVYSTETRNYPAYLAYPTPNAMLRSTSGRFACKECSMHNA